MNVILGHAELVSASLVVAVELNFLDVMSSPTTDFGDDTKG